MNRLVKSLLIAVTLAGGLGQSAGRAQDVAQLAATVPPGTKLVIGDPTTQKALELSGLIKEIPFEIEFVNLSGGPQTSEAFRAHALDVGAVAEIPSIFANWNNLPVRNIAYRERKDPISHPVYRFGIAPGVDVKTLTDFRGKRIAFSPGQAQGALVLRALQAAGLTRNDVTLVEIPSTGDVYPVALASHQVDIAPIGGVYIRRYLTQYGHDGATVIEHGLRDDTSHLYAPQWVLDDPAKAAALGIYVDFWAKATKWINEHPQEWIEGYYVKDQGLTPEDGQYLVDLTGEQVIPDSWDEVIGRHQQTIDLLAKELGYPPLSAEQIFDRRYEKRAAAAIAGQ